MDPLLKKLAAPLPLLEAARASYTDGDKTSALFFLREALDAVHLEVVTEMLNRPASGIGHPASIPTAKEISCLH